MVLRSTSRGPATGGICLYPYASPMRAKQRHFPTVPDYLVNAGALSTFHPGGGRFLLHGERRSTAAIQAIGDKTKSLLSRAKTAGVSPLELPRDFRAV